jgi:hypothetical protein
MFVTLGAMLAFVVRINWQKTAFGVNENLAYGAVGVWSL